MSILRQQLIFKLAQKVVSQGVQKGEGDHGGICTCPLALKICHFGRVFSVFRDNFGGFLGCLSPASPSPPQKKNFVPPLQKNFCRLQ